MEFSVFNVYSFLHNFFSTIYFNQKSRQKSVSFLFQRFPQALTEHLSKNSKFKRYLSHLHKLSAMSEFFSSQAICQLARAHRCRWRTPSTVIGGASITDNKTTLRAEDSCTHAEFCQASAHCDAPPPTICTVPLSSLHSVPHPQTQLSASPFFLANYPGPNWPSFLELRCSPTCLQLANSTADNQPTRLQLLVQLTRVINPANP